MSIIDEPGRLTQRQFRHANGRLLQAVTGGNVSDGQLVSFFCECADEVCHGRIRITASRYEGTHLGHLDYIILPGHLRIPGEEVLEANQYYEVVQKAA